MQKLIFNIENKDFDTIVSQIESRTNSNISGVVKGNKKYCGSSVRIIESETTKIEITILGVSDIKTDFKTKQPFFGNIDFFKSVCEQVIASS